MTDWESDPELKALRDEFVESFESRKLALISAISAVRLDEIQSLAHKIAGCAEIYGFPFLTEIAGGIDDYLSERKSVDSARVLRWSLLLTEALALGASSRKDPTSLRVDVRAAEITSYSGSLASGSRPESS